MTNKKKNTPSINEYELWTVKIEYAPPMMTYPRLYVVHSIKQAKKIDHGPSEKLRHWCAKVKCAQPNENPLGH